MNRPRLLGTLALAASLFVFWLLLSGIYTPFLVLCGLGSSIAVAALAQRMEVADREGHPIHLGLAALTYWPWLLKEIFKSGWQVTRIILDPRLPVSPTFVRFRPSQKTAVALATHANSITLTPGTITVDASHEEFLVHALTREGAAAVVDSEMDRRVSRMDRGS
ncbi:MAG: Cation antiporter [Burkholderiales bacterium]|jgi:multicomponent Na+:H+ antiporter subunit E|nr:Cation antiporter [Burkholderiales bacterium]